MRRAGRSLSRPRPSNSPGHAHITNQIGNIVDYVDLYFYFGAFRPVVADPGVRGIQHAADQAGAVARRKIPPDRHLRVTPRPAPLPSVKSTEHDGRTAHMAELTLERSPAGPGRGRPSEGVRA